MLAHSPRIVTENLVLLLDAANPRNFNLTAVEVLVVAGGGGGSGNYYDDGAGGGGGGLIYNSNFAVTPGTQLTVTVGNGGAASVGGEGGDGGSSVFGALTAIGGGGGAAHRSAGRAGGSGGGSAGQYGGSDNAVGGNGTAGQGFAGGTATGYSGSGGGGASSIGFPASWGFGGNGGNGKIYSISGTATYYAGGGGGYGYSASSTTTGGLGGGGNGGNPTPLAPTPGTPNTGGGGGGGRTSGQNPFVGTAAGGSGIIIVRYPGPQKAIGGTITSVGGDTIHTFTTSGNFTPLVNTNGSAVLGLSDLSGNRNFGTTAGSPTYNSANGGSLYFEGSDEYVTTGGVIVPNSSSPYTVSVWCYRNRNNVGLEELLSQWTSANSGNSFFFGFDNSNVRFTDNWTPVTVPGAGNTGVWMNLVGVYSVSNAFIYLNGSLSATRGSGFSYGGTGNFIIGRQGELSSEYFSGRISNTSIYNRALTAAEVSQNYNALRGRYGL